MKKINGFAIGIACALTVSSMAGISVSADPVTKEIALDSVKVLVNGKTVEQTNIVYEDHTYVPLRAISESIGCTVAFDDATQTATIKGKVKKPEDLIKTFTKYDDEYAALKQQYDMLIADQQQKGNTDEVAKLQKDFTDKTTALQAKYATNNQGETTLVMQQKEVEFDAIKVVVNGNPVTETNILYEDHTYVPLRAISESIGCEVVWDEATRTALIAGELVPEAVVVYTSYEEEYAELKARYDKQIAEQTAAGKQAYDDIIKQSGGATGLGNAQTQLADAAKAPFDKRVAELQDEFKKLDDKLKIKYKVAE